MPSAVLRKASMPAVLGLALFGGTALAATHDYQVLYDSSQQAVLQPGSDDLGTAVALDAGDSFNYTLTTATGSAWRVTQASDFFATFALAVGPNSDPAFRVGDYTLTFSLGGATQKTLSGVGEETAYVHIGPNYANLDTGFTFDSFTLHYTLTSAELAVDNGNGGFDHTGQAGVTFVGGNSLLPIWGAPEASTGISLVSSVPEPQSIALMVAGLLAVAGAARAQRRR